LIYEGKCDTMWLSKPRCIIIFLDRKDDFMSIRIRNSENGQEYVSYFIMEPDVTFQAKSGNTAPDDIHAYVNKHMQHQYIIPMIFAGWILFMMTMGAIASIINLISGNYADETAGGIDEIIGVMTYGFSFVFTLSIAIALAFLIKKLYRLNKCVNRDEYLWRRGIVTQSGSYHGKHRTVKIDTEPVSPMTGIDYELAHLNDEYIVIYRLNKARTQITSSFTFCADLSKNASLDTAMSSLTGTKSDIEPETTDNIPDEIHTKLRNETNKLFIMRLIGAVMGIMPFVMFISFGMMFLGQLSGPQGMLFTLLNDPEIQAEIKNSPELYMPFIIIGIILLWGLIINIRYFIKIILITVKVNQKKYEWRTGTVTNLQTKRRNRRVHHYIWVDNECCRPLGFMDFSSLSINQTAVVVYIKIPTYKIMPYAFKSDSF